MDSVANRKWVKILNKLGDINLDERSSCQNCDDLSEKFQVLKSDFLYNLKVLAKKEEANETLRHRVKYIETELESKNQELLEIKEEYENLRTIQSNLHEECAELRMNLQNNPVTANTHRSQSYNFSDNSPSVRNTHDFTKYQKIISQLGERIKEQEFQLNAVKEEKNVLQNQLEILQKQKNAYKYRFEEESKQLKTAQQVLSEKYKQSMLNYHTLEADLIRVNNNIRKAREYLIQVSESFHFKFPNEKIKGSLNDKNINQFLELFVHEVRAVVSKLEQENEYLKRKTEKAGNEHDSQVSGNAQTERELMFYKQQNCVLINVIKELKQNILRQDHVSRCKCQEFHSSQAGHSQTHEKTNRDNKMYVKDEKITPKTSTQTNFITDACVSASEKQLLQVNSIAQIQRELNFYKQQNVALTNVIKELKHRTPPQEHTLNSRPKDFILNDRTNSIINEKPNREDTQAAKTSSEKDILICNSENDVSTTNGNLRSLQNERKQNIDEILINLEKKVDSLLEADQNENETGVKHLEEYLQYLKNNLFERVTRKLKDIEDSGAGKKPPPNKKVVRIKTR